MSRLPALLQLRRQSWLYRLRLLLIGLVVVWAAQHALFGRTGYLALRQRQRQYRVEVAKVHALEDQNRALNQSVRALRTDPEAIENIAREQLHLTRPGEVVYTYPVATPNGPAPAVDAALRQH